MKRDVREIPLLGEMSQSDKRVAVFAEKPSPTAIQETFVFNFVGDGFPHVPKRIQYIYHPEETKPFQTTRTIINSERSDH